MRASIPDRLDAALADRYRIERELGAGGMATVYLATDLKHNRKVALKVLKPELAAVVGADRFLAEIETTANLQHPNILPLFDSGQADSLLFYVMPYADGETLRDRMDRERQLPVDDAVRIATSVAEALAYAHSHGVIHRDIKPANILLQAGKPVIADFGIALAVGVAGGGRLTETGLSLGTPHYMSPEQAMGDQHVGPAADIYALGCVLYEMLVGEPPYTGATPQAVLGKIITGSADPVTKHRKSVQPNVEAAIGCALEKVPADRFASAAEFAKALGDPAFRHGGDATNVAAARGPWNRLTVGFAALAAAAVAMALWPRSGPAQPPSLFDITPDSVAVASTPTSTVIAISRDGTRIAFQASIVLGGGIYVRDLGELAARAVRGAEAGSMPRFSPDGSSILFLDQNGKRLRRVPSIGGAAVTVADSADLFGVSWGDNDEVVFTRGRDLWRVSAGGGAPVLLAQPDSQRGHLIYRWPQVLPGGKAALIALWKGADSPDNAELGVVSLADGEVTELGIRGTNPLYVPSGHVVFAGTDGVVLAVPFSLRRLRPTGAAVPVLEGVSVRRGGGADLALSETGTLIYRTGAAGTKYEPVWVDRGGKTEEIEPGWTVQGIPNNVGLALSPDNTRLALSIQGASGKHDLWIKRLATRTLSRFTTEGNVNMKASWSPDGGFLTFIRNDAEASPMVSSALLQSRADGTGVATMVIDTHTLGLTGTGRDLWDAFYSPDGKWLVYRVGSGTNFSNPDIFALRPGVDSVGTPLLATSFTEWNPALSPDGKWLAYTSDETGRYEVYVRPFPLVDTGKWPVSTEGGNSPVWAKSGRELFYQKGTGEMVAVDIETRPTFTPGRQNALFGLDGFLTNASHAIYDVSRDDRRFVMLRSASLGEASRLILVQNFFEELKEKVR